MEIYRTKIKHLSGTSYSEIYSAAKSLYKKIVSRTKRRPYMRSAYFKKEKVFIDYFWDHLGQKNQTDRFRRLRQYSCALDLIQNTHIKPETKVNPNRRSELVHRFKGINGNNEVFYVQIKEDTRNNEKNFMSVFPEE